MKNPEKRIYRRNAYRVLLTRARQGMILFVPKGDGGDSTCLPEDFDTTSRYLIDCGVTPI
jgi:hypothetical protein